MGCITFSSTWNEVRILSFMKLKCYVRDLVKKSEKHSNVGKFWAGRVDVDLLSETSKNI